jgi:hypothetical protein
MIDIERQKHIEADITDTLGVKITQQYCQNVCSISSMILAADGDKPANLEESLALNVFLTACIKRYYHIDPEMFDMEVQKSYRSMEMIIEEAAREREQHAPAPEPIDQLPPEVVQMMAHDGVTPPTPFPEGELPEAIDGDDNIREFPTPAPEVDTDAETETDEDDETPTEADNGEVVGDVAATDTDAEVEDTEDTDEAEDAEVSEDVNEAEPADTTVETEETVDAEPEAEVADEVPESVDNAEGTDDDEASEDVEPTQEGE